MTIIRGEQVWSADATPDDLLRAIGEPCCFAETLLEAQARSVAARATAYDANMNTYPDLSTQHAYWLDLKERAMCELRAYVYAVLIYREDPKG